MKHQTFGSFLSNINENGIEIQTKTIHLKNGHQLNIFVQSLTFYNIKNYYAINFNKYMAIMLCLCMNLWEKLQNKLIKYCISIHAQEKYKWNVQYDFCCINQQKWNRQIGTHYSNRQARSFFMCVFFSIFSETSKPNGKMNKNGLTHLLQCHFQFCFSKLVVLTHDILGQSKIHKYDEFAVHSRCG